MNDIYEFILRSFHDEMTNCENLTNILNVGKKNV